MEFKYFIIIMIFVVLFSLGLATLPVNTTEENSTNIVETEQKDEIIIVTDKWIKRTEEKDLYMIGTENEVFKIEDNAFILKFNSSDIYNKIKIRT